MTIYDSLIAKAIGGSGGGGGSSDFSTAEVVVVNNTMETLYIPCCDEVEEPWPAGAYYIGPFNGTCRVILYKGVAYAEVGGAASIVVTGSIEADYLNLIITGNGTITINEP